MARFDSKSRKYSSTSVDDDFENLEGSKPITPEERYLKAEFTAMDIDGDGMLSTSEFLKLIQFLGYMGDAGSANALLRRVNKDQNPYITIDEYYTALKKNPDVMSRTARMRDLFRMFDKNLDASAHKSDIYKGFEEMGFEVDKEMKEEIDKMDTNKDGHVTYVDFIRAQLKQRKVI